MTYSAINAIENQEIETPNLDKLVSQGTSFTNSYNMGSWTGAVCAASRAMLLSGRSVWNVNKFRENWQQNNDLDKTWGKLMESSGYETYMTGKWHVDAKADSVFQNVTHIRPGMPKDAWRHKTDTSRVMPIGYNRPLSVNDTTWSPSNPKFGGYWEGGKHWSEVLKDDAIGFIDKATKSNKPFFMFLAFNAPHDPRQAPQEFLDKYPIENISLPKNWQPEYPFNEGMGSGRGLRDEALAPFPRTEYAIKKHIQEYYALITHMDAQIGDILNKLEMSGKMENTYIIFTADHGLAMGKHGLLGKQSVFEHSIKAPFIITGPRIPKNKKNSENIYLQDAMATSLELAGAKKPDYIFFNSVLDLATNNDTKSHYNSIYNGYIDFQRMIKKDNFKLILYPKINKVLLFNLENDPDEMHDLSNDISYQQKIKQLFIELIKVQKEINDPLDISEIYSNLL